MPAVITDGLRACQIDAVSALEAFHGAEPSARAGADGDRRRQDLHGLHAELPAAGARRIQAHPVPGRPRQPRPPDARRISRLSAARHRAVVLRNLQRPEARRGGPRQGCAGRDRHDPARLFRSDRQGIVGGRGRGFVVRTVESRYRAARCLQSVDPDRELRPRHHRRMPPLDLRHLAAGAGIFRRLHGRPHRDALAAHARFLRQEPRRAVSLRAFRRRRRQRRLRHLPHPHRDRRTRRRR